MQTLIDKFEQEAEEKGTGIMRVVCNHVIEKLSGANSELIAKIKKDKLTLDGAVTAMRKEAEKNSSGGVGYLSDEEGYRIIDKYFGFGEKSKSVSLFDLL